MEKAFDCSGWDKIEGRAAHTFIALVLYVDVHFWKMRLVTMTTACLVRSS